MSKDSRQKIIDHILRYAIRNGGFVDYTYMYKFGFADNIPPSEEFNNELRKYGVLSNYSMYSAWGSFTINEDGRRYIMEKDGANESNHIIKKTLNCTYTAIISLGFGLGVVFIPGIIFAYFFCNIDANETYDWFWGIWHGLFALPNIVRCKFNDDVLFIANNHTTAYVVSYWLALLTTIIKAFIDLVKLTIIDVITEWYNTL